MNPLRTRTAKAIGVLALFGVVAVGCDSTEVPDEVKDEAAPLCPEPLSAEAGDYLPLELGETWTFEYGYRTAQMGGNKRIEGDLSWTTTQAGDCEEDRRQYIVAESFDGVETTLFDGRVIGEESVSWSSQYVVDVWADSMEVPNWHTPVPRFGGSSASDTLVVSGSPGLDGPGCIGKCTLGYAGGATMRLIEGVGMLSRRYHGHYSAGGDNYETLTRVSD